MMTEARSYQAFFCPWTPKNELYVQGSSNDAAGIRRNFPLLDTTRPGWTDFVHGLAHGPAVHGLHIDYFSLCKINPLLKDIEDYNENATGSGTGVQ
jgi:hypothetical protein